MNAEMIPAAFCSPLSLLACAPLIISGGRGFLRAPAEPLRRPGRLGLAGILRTPLNSVPPWLILLCPCPVTFQKPPLPVQTESFFGTPGSGCLLPERTALQEASDYSLNLIPVERLTS